jgi:hypothetical protein
MCIYEIGGGKRRTREGDFCASIAAFGMHRQKATGKWIRI